MPIAQRELLGEVPKVKLFSLNEVNPKRDLAGFTALVGASVIAYFWAGLAFRKRKGILASKKKKKSATSAAKKRR